MLTNNTGDYYNYLNYNYLSAPLIEPNSVVKLIDPTVTIPKHIAISPNPMMPMHELIITAIGQSSKEEFRSKTTISQMDLNNYVLGAEEFVNMLCEEKLKDMRFDLARKAVYDIFVISGYLNGDLIWSLSVDNNDPTSDVHWIYR